MSASVIGFQQATSPVQITTPLGTDKLLVSSFQGEERLSGLFRYTVELYSEDAALDFTQVVGKAVTVSISLPTGGTQYFNGIVAGFALTGRNERTYSYRAEIYPWLWLLTLNSDCKIFQNKTAPDIIKQVFSDLGFTDFQDSLTATYDPREFCVQYGETAFNFVSRLMEEEGIFYYFTHDSSTHKLVLADDTSGYASCPIATVRYRDSSPEWETDDTVTSCSLAQRVTLDQYKADDFNFETPSTDLTSTASGAATARSYYFYPGNFKTSSAGEARVNLRLTAFEHAGKYLSGRSTCRGFQAGGKFTLAGHYADSANAGYVLLSVIHSADQRKYSNEFEAVPDSVVCRPVPRTPKPQITGCQTAIVTGKSGEEIWTDQYGRIVVQFHWDQLGTNDENSSCWIRVSQGWAGTQWGSIFLPRVGQEVIVSFLDGDPDRPLVTGCVYNAQQTVPYTLPDEQTKSTVKSNSSKGGGGFNEIRFEDKAGSEEIFIQAQKDMNVTILNDQTIAITNSRTATIQKADDTLTVSQGNRSITVSQGNETYSVKGTRDITATGAETHTNGADFTQKVSGNYTLKVSGNLSIEASGSVSIKSGTSFDNNAGTSLTNKAGTSLTNDAGVSLTNKGAASQTVDGGGMLTLKGGLVKIN